MTSAAAYLFQFAPIIAGILLLVALRCFIVPRQKIRLYDPTYEVDAEKSLYCICNNAPISYREAWVADKDLADALGSEAMFFINWEGNPSIWNGYIYCRGDIKLCVTKRLANDTSILEGHGIKEIGSAEEAFSSSGFIDLEDFPELRVRGIAHSYTKLRLFAYDSVCLRKQIFEFGKESGLLLAYLPNNVELVGL